MLQIQFCRKYLFVYGKAFKVDLHMRSCLWHYALFISGLTLLGKLESWVNELKSIVRLGTIGVLLVVIVIVSLARLHGISNSLNVYEPNKSYSS